MKRENLRRTILAVSAFLMPFTIFFISPAVIVMAASKGVINSSAIVYFLIFIAALFAGRIWCGWLCPCGAMQEIIGRGCEKKTSEGFLNSFKYAVFIIWAVIIAFLFAAAGKIAGVNPLFGTEDGLFPEILYVYLFLLAAILVFTFVFGGRFACRYFCPMGVITIIGRKTGDALSLPGLRLAAEPEKCTGCGLCDAACPMGLKVSEMVKADDTKNNDCITCGACTDACKRGAVRLELSRKKR